MLSDLDILPTAQVIVNKSGSWFRWTLKTVPTRISNPRHHTQAKRAREDWFRGEREREVRRGAHATERMGKGWTEGEM